MRRRRASAESIWPRCRRSACTRASNGPSDPFAASVESAPVMSAVLNMMSALNSAASAWAVENCVPLSSASPSLGPSASGTSPCCRRASAAGQSPIRHHHLADADHGGCHVRQRRQVARGANRALARDHRDDPVRQHRLQHSDGGGPHTGGALREARDLERHHEAHDLPPRRLADAGGMREHDVGLQPGQVGGLDADAGELAEAGVDAIDRLAPGDDGVHRPRAGLHPRQERGIDPHVSAAIDVPPHIEANVARSQRDRVRPGDHSPLHTRRCSGLRLMR